MIKETERDRASNQTNAAYAEYRAADLHVGKHTMKRFWVSLLAALPLGHVTALVLDAIAVDVKNRWLGIFD